jgi:hypothetical protein
MILLTAGAAVAGVFANIGSVLGVVKDVIEIPGKSEINIQKRINK